MNFIYFICPEVPQYSKYCEAFFNYLTYGYKNWTRDRYVSTVPKEKDARSRYLKGKNLPDIEEMKAGDFVMDKIYQKVITADCYQHYYSKITDEDIDVAEEIIFITSQDKPMTPPKYLLNNKTSLSVWKVSNINKPSDFKFNLFENLCRRLVNIRKS